MINHDHNYFEFWWIVECICQIFLLVVRTSVSHTGLETIISHFEEFRRPSADEPCVNMIYLTLAITASTQTSITEIVYHATCWVNMLININAIFLFVYRFLPWHETSYLMGCDWLWLPHVVDWQPVQCAPCLSWHISAHPATIKIVFQEERIPDNANASTAGQCFAGAGSCHQSSVILFRVVFISS